MQLKDAEFTSTWSGVTCNYAQGVQGRDIPEAMRQMRKHRKHRAGSLLEDEVACQRGKNSHKKSRIEKLKAQRDS